MKKTLELAQGQWPSILGALAGLSHEQLTDKHQPCPLCGGKDRYRFDDQDGNGSWFCNKCGGKTQSGGAGNGMDMLMRKNNWDFKRAASEVERHLGISKPKPSIPIKNAEAVYHYSEDFVVARVPDAKTGKSFRQLWFDGNKWVYKLPDHYKKANSKPLYNLGKIRATKGWVLVTEGEKACEAAAKLFPSFACTTWSGGCKGHGKTDFSPLKGRKIALWPDADEEGQAAMQAVADKLLRLGADKVRIVTPPEEAPKGWDIADAEWSPDEAVDYIRHNYIEFNQPQSPEPKPLIEEPEEHQPRQLEVGSHFTCLGYSDDFYFYQPHGTGQVTRLSRASHNGTNLVALAPLSFWESWAPDGKGGVKWLSATSMLFELGQEAGFYDPEDVRGRGAWWDNGRTVLHLGDRIIADNKAHPVNELFESDYIYERLGKLKAYGSTPPLNDQGAFEILDVAQQFLWENPTSGLLLAGWATLAPICGALQWRPHIWLTAAAGSGKSAILDRFIGPLIADMGQFVVGNTTEAGIRQSLRSDAMPVIFDEAESNEKNDQLRMQNILALARIASSESQAKTIKGSSTGEANRFHVRSMFMMSSISTHLKQGADRSRFAQLTLCNPSTIPNSEKRAEHWERLDRSLDKFITPEIGRALIHRTINLIPVIRESAKVFIRAFADESGSQRQGDQYGTLLAGMWSLQSSDVVSPEQAIQIIQDNNFESYAEQTEISDEEKCIQHILQHQMRVEGDGKTVTRSVGELVEVASLSTSDFDFDTGHAVKLLGRNGLRVDHQQRLLYVSNTAKGLATILQDTPWSSSWPTMLKRLPEAASTGKKTIAFAGPLKTKAVQLKIDLL